MRTFEQPESGLLRTTVMQDQKDPARVFVLVVFESEEKARARETDPLRQEGVQILQRGPGRTPVCGGVGDECRWSRA